MPEKKNFIVSSHQSAEILYRVEAENEEDATEKVMSGGSGDLVGILYGDLWDGKAETQVWEIAEEQKERWPTINHQDIY